MKKKYFRLFAACVAVVMALCGLSMSVFAETGNGKADALAGTIGLAETDVDISQYPQQILDVINAEREKEGLAALQFDDVVMKAAQTRAAELETSYSHTRPNGKEWFTALDELGHKTKPRAENIAIGTAPAQYVANVWLESPGHRKNIMNKKYNYIGIAVYQTADGELTWEQLFVK